MKTSNRLRIFGLTLLPLAFVPGIASAEEDENPINVETTRRFDADPNHKLYAELIGQAMKAMPTKPADAEALLLKALSLKSEFIVPMYAQKELATLYLSQRRYRAAIKVYDALFKDGLQWGGSEEPKILADYADALIGVGEIKRAMAALNAAIRSPNGSKSNSTIVGFDEERIPAVAEVRATMHLLRGIHYKREFQLEQAKAELMNAVKLSPRSDLAHYHLGRYYEEVNKISEASAEYEKAVRFGSDEVRLLAEKQLKSITPTKP